MPSERVNDRNIEGAKPRSTMSVVAFSFAI